MSFAAENDTKINHNIDGGSVENVQKEKLAAINELSKQTNQFVRDINRLRQYETTLGTSKDTQHMRSEGTLLSSQLAATLYSLTLKLEQINAEVENSVESKLRPPVSKVLDYMTKQINDAENEFFKAQQRYLEKSQQCLLVDKDVSIDRGRGSSQSGSGSNTVEESQALLGQQQKVINQMDQTYIPQLHTDLVQQREAAIVNISQGVQEINSIFKDLDGFVNQQGQQIDSIENNIQNYSSNNQMANQELVRADNYQRQKGKWSCILLVILVVVILIVLALIS